MKTAYDVLGLNREATPIDIEHSYHQALNAFAARSAQQLPSKDEQKRLRELREAYLVLSSPSQRYTYDHELQMCEQQRSQVIHTMQTVLAVLSLLGGLLLIGTSFYSVLQHGQTVEHVTDKH